jgi:hypothetical protein
MPEAVNRRARSQMSSVGKCALGSGGRNIVSPGNEICGAECAASRDRTVCYDANPARRGKDNSRGRWPLVGRLLTRACTAYEIAADVVQCVLRRNAKITARPASPCQPNAPPPLFPDPVAVEVTTRVLEPLTELSPAADEHVSV